MVLACDASLFSEAAHWSVPRPQDANKNGNFVEKILSRGQKKFLLMLIFFASLERAAEEEKEDKETRKETIQSEVL